MNNKLKCINCSSTDTEQQDMDIYEDEVIICFYCKKCDENMHAVYVFSEMIPCEG